MQFWWTILWWCCSGWALAQSPALCHHMHKRWASWMPEQVITVTSTIDMQTLDAIFCVDPRVRYIDGAVTHHFRATTKVDTLAFELSDTLVIDSIVYHGQRLSPVREGPFAVYLPLPAPLPQGTIDSITLYYHGAPPSSGFGSFGVDSVLGEPVLWTLSQPYGSREWWPVAELLNDKIDALNITVITPKEFRGVSNGIIVKDTVIQGHRITTFRHRYPITPYLVAIAAAPYTLLADTLDFQGGPLAVNNFVLPSEVDTVREQLDFFYPSFQFLDSLFTPYPFLDEQYGHARIGWPGGMEHQTISFVGSYNYELLVHEAAHQWFGDWVTCGSWQHIWLNEGFATYLSGLAYERFSPTLYWPRFREVREEIILRDPDGSVFVEDTTSVAAIFDREMSYFKGSWVLHQLRWVVGDKAFFDACRNYLNDPQLRKSYALTADLQRHMEAASGQDLDDFFAQWIYGEGYPVYEVAWRPTAQGADIFYTQTTSHPSVPFYDLPFPVQLSGGGQDTLVVLYPSQPEQWFGVGWKNPVEQVTIDPDNWLLGKQSVRRLPVSHGSIQVTPLSGHRYLWQTSNPYTSFSRVNVYDMQGRVVLQLGAQQDVFEIDLSALPQGIYVVMAWPQGRQSKKPLTHRLVR